ncbi:MULTISPECIES: SDR family oxidoreductase [Kytococcus]|uniref:SDR family oxidoreductase n=1 Tax=Kytococcus TaxID=57499 RepID=UPI0008A25937|nr:MULTISPECIES: SDR family oxidoreductase [Kytococcus]OFS06496.1 NAD-dependent dehydratase [Kytococcus sp. HMSC28H12]
MADILIIGGHGKIALQAAALLAERGDEVTSVVRNPDHAADVRATGATPLVLDVEHAQHTELVRAMRGRDAVVWSAGAGGGDLARTYAVDQRAAIASMRAARDAGVPRYVMVSFFGSALDHPLPYDEGFFHYAQAKAVADAHLRGTSLAWTILAPSRLTDEPGTGRIEVGAQQPSQVPRADVAATIAHVLGEGSRASLHRTLTMNTGDTPIAEAIA